MKIVINACYGGFSLSHEAVLRYLQLKGLKVWLEDDRFGFKSYWLAPPEDRPKPLPGNWMDHSEDARKKYNEDYYRVSFYSRDIPRDCPTLVSVVEEMGGAADGRCAGLKVVEIPDGIEWEIEEYDGNEWISEKHRTWS